MKLKLIALGVSTAAMMAMPTAAFADEPVSAQLDFTGERACECEVDLGQNAVLFGDLGRRGQAQRQSIRADVFCNQPSEVTFESENGFLLLQATNPLNEPNDPTETDHTSQANPGFSAGLDYNASIPSVGLAADSSQILGTTPTSVGVIPAQNRSNVRVDFDTIAESQPLLGGDYEDTLTVTLTPQGV